MVKIVSVFATRRSLRRGQSLAEYALVLSFVSLLSVVVMSTFAMQLRGIFLPLANALEALRLAI